MRAGTDRVPRRRLPSLALGGLAVLVAGAFATALLVLPVKAWMNQRHALSSSSTELQALEEANRGLQADVDRLRTRPGIAQAAREELGVVKRNEKAYRVLVLPTLTATFPDGWLYPTIKTLVTERVATVGTSASQSGDSVADPDAGFAPAPASP